MKIYVFDASSVSVLRNYYPKQFPTFWSSFEAATDTGSVVSVREVFNELKELLAGRWLWDWVKVRRGVFPAPTPEETSFVAEIFAVPHFRTLVGEMQRLKGKPVADPFVVAAARVRSGTVVTEESNKPNAAKIPNVCDHFGISCTNLEGFLAENEWEF